MNTSNVNFVDADGNPINLDDLPPGMREVITSVIEEIGKGGVFRPGSVRMMNIGNPQTREPFMALHKDGTIEIGDGKNAPITAHRHRLDDDMVTALIDARSAAEKARIDFEIARLNDLKSTFDEKNTLMHYRLRGGYQPPIETANYIASVLADVEHHMSVVDTVVNTYYTMCRMAYEVLKLRNMLDAEINAHHDTIAAGGRARRARMNFMESASEQLRVWMILNRPDLFVSNDVTAADFEAAIEAYSSSNDDEPEIDDDGDDDSEPGGGERQ